MLSPPTGVRSNKRSSSIGLGVRGGGVSKGPALSPLKPNNLEVSAKPRELTANSAACELSWMLYTRVAVSVYPLSVAQYVGGMRA
jgi:hypothetical protein